MARGLQTWSKTAASNSTADTGVNWAEGQAPSSVNDSARAEMASAAMWRDDNNGTLSGTLATATYTVTSNQTSGALTAGYTIAFQLGSDMPATALLNLDSLGAKPLRPYAGTDFAGGEYKSGGIVRATYATSNSGEWLVNSNTQLGSSVSSVVTANITAKAVTYAKIQDVTDKRFLANFTGGAAAPSEYSAVGPNVSGTTITFPFPVAGSFKNLSIKVASTTTVTVAADFVSTTDGTNYQTTAVSSTVNLATTGADALDAGSIAIDTWYAIWVIVKADGTTKCLASTSFTAPTLPATYTFKARVGAVQTIHGSATLYGTWQLGRNAWYVPGLAQTTVPPVIDSGTKNTYSATSPTLGAVSVSRFVPSTAASIKVIANQGYNAGTTAALIVAPSSSYSGANNGPNGSSGFSYPIFLVNSAPNVGNVTADIFLESTNIYWASSGTGAAIACYGWVDNI